MKLIMQSSDGIEHINLRVNKLNFQGKLYVAEVDLGGVMYRVSGAKTDSIEDFVNECSKWYDASK